MAAVFRKSFGDVSLAVDDHDVHKESGGGEDVPVLAEQRHVSVSCVWAQRDEVVN